MRASPRSFWRQKTQLGRWEVLSDEVGGARCGSSPGKLGSETSRDLSYAPGGPFREGSVRAVRLWAAGLALVMVGGLALSFMLERTGIVAIGQQAQYALVVAGVLDKVIGALVLFLLAADGERVRLRWVASGLLVFGLGPFMFNALIPPSGASVIDIEMYRRMSIWTFAFALFVIGLSPKAPLWFSWRWALAVLAVFSALMITIAAALDSLPPLATTGRREIAANLFDSALQPGLTAWHFALSGISLSLAVTATIGALRRNSDEGLEGWLVASMVLLAGAQLYHLFWPLPIGSVLTGMFVLHLAAGTTIILGAILELRRIAAEHSRLLAVEREHLRRMRELAILKADFTAIVAHELASPLAAIRGYVDMLLTGKLTPDRQVRTLDEIRDEADRLSALVADVRAAASVEREDFSVRIAPVDLDSLLSAAATYARTLPGTHPLTMKVSAHGYVLADADRIGQVLRNLLDNAAAHSPEGAPIELRATPTGPTNGAAKWVRIEVADRGSGIRADDLNLIFEKFWRGETSEETVGTGLGLYLSMRIVQAHGGEITVESTPGRGSVFAFELEAA